MKTILLPVDFSAASDDAIRYVAGLSADPEYQIGRIILLNSYHVSAYAHIMPSADWVLVGTHEVQAKRSDLRKQLGELRETLQQDVGQAIQVETIESEQPLLRSILTAIAAYEPDLLVTGSDLPAEGPASEVSDFVIAIAKVSPIGVDRSAGAGLRRHPRCAAAV